MKRLFFSKFETFFFIKVIKLLKPKFRKCYQILRIRSSLTYQPHQLPQITAKITSQTSPDTLVTKHTVSNESYLHKKKYQRRSINNQRRANTKVLRDNLRKKKILIGLGRQFASTLNILFMKIKNNFEYLHDYLHRPEAVLGRLFAINSLQKQHFKEKKGKKTSKKRLK